MLNNFPPRYGSAEQLHDLQQRGLRWTVSHAWENSPFYRKSFEQAGISPDDITTLEDLQKLPFTGADDLRAGYPLPLLSVPQSEVVRIHSSSGTTGKRKILCYTRNDIENWSYMFARCFEMAGLTSRDRVQICVGYGLWTAGTGFQTGCERFGAMAIPVGPGNLDLQISFLLDMQSTVLCCTGSMGLLLAEEVDRRGLRDRINLKKVIMGAERTSEAMIAEIKDHLGLDEVYDIPGLTEVYGPGTGLSCSHNTGIHYWSDFYILELLDPETLKPVQPGEIGEMVYTTLCKEAAPLIRYRSRDLTRLVEGECPCGCPLPRHDKILGRSDDVVIFRGVNIYPGQVDEILSGVAGVGCEYQVILENGEDGRDYMQIRVERAMDGCEGNDAAVAKKINSAVKHALLVSCNPEIVPHGALPRSERKTPRMFDRRKF
jgi:phenylacetate-CoA ligase